MAILLDFSRKPSGSFQGGTEELPRANRSNDGDDDDLLSDILLHNLVTPGVDEEDPLSILKIEAEPKQKIEVPKILATLVPPLKKPPLQ